MQEQTDFDVLIVGAGLSGIAAAYHLQDKVPGKSYAILEGRAHLGGTWDFFRYPGIRSDSDMYTLGFSFRPWSNPKAIADGPSILAYLEDTAREYGIDQKIRYGLRVERASWSSERARWTVYARDAATGELREFTCSFLFMCSGYYDYDEGYTPDFKGRENFKGTVVHPQFWPEDLDYSGKRVVVIGSGATAVTLVPELAAKASHVVMLQRSPTYMISGPDKDRLAEFLRGKVSEQAAYEAVRWKNVLLGMAFYQYCKRFPAHAKKLLVGQVGRLLRDDDAAQKHFAPRYNPWDQRVCLVPNADLFKAVREGRASVVTEQLESFTEKGLLLASGEELEADIVVTATGLKLKFLGGMQVDVDGERVEPSKRLAYKGMMCSDVPNLALAMGYTNASWTLKCDLTAQYVCKLLQHMDAHGYKRCMPHNDDPTVRPEPLLDFSSGYVVRSIDKFPRQGNAAPWRVHQNYALDRFAMRHQPVADGVMQFA